MAQPEATRAAPNNTTGAAETIGDVPDNSIAEEAGKPDPVWHITASFPTALASVLTESRRLQKLQSNHKCLYLHHSRSSLCVCPTSSRQLATPRYGACDSPLQKPMSQPRSCYKNISTPTTATLPKL